MTKGYMAEYDENLSAAETSNLARRFVIEDCALRYQISLQMAEKLIKNNAAVAPELSPKATRPDMEAVWPCRRMDRHDRRNSDDQVEEMMIDGCEERGEMAHGSSEAERRFPRTREELFHAGKPWYYVGQPRVPSFVQTAAMMPESGYSFAGRPPHYAPYYVFGYPPYVPPMAFRRHSVHGNKHSEHLYPRHRDVPAKSTHGDQAPPETETVVRPSEPEGSPNSGVKTRLVISPKGRSLFAARRNMDNEELVNSQETSLRSLDDSRNSNDIIHVNSCRPSVIVMQTSPDNSPRSSIHNDISESERGSPEYSHCQRVPSPETYHCVHDPEATDSDSTTTPPTSPLSFQSAASSDERFSSDSPRSYDSNPEKPHKCHICGRAFRKHSALIIHHRVHSGEKPYKCPECAKNFSISGNLRRHFLIHTGERPYICPECSRAFNNPSHLTRHRRKLHKFNVEKK